MKKIAIKYSEENWANVKVAVDLIRSTGQTVIKRKDSVLLEGVTALRNNWDIAPDKFDYSQVSITAMYEEGFTILSMPEDMDKLKEALGIEVPKNGKDYTAIADITARVATTSKRTMLDFITPFINLEFERQTEAVKLIQRSKEDHDKAVATLRKPIGRIILNQYEAIEILVDDFEMSHGDGKILLTGKNK